LPREDVYVVKITVEADNDQVSPATPISNLFFFLGFCIWK
jgi:hypothetical protein